MKRPALDKHLRSVLKDANQAYRRAIADEIRGDDPSMAWAQFQAALSALLFSSYLFGARQAATKAKMREADVRRIAGEEDKPERFDRMETGLLLEGFGQDYLKPIAEWFRGRVPISRGTFDSLVDACQHAAGAITSDEQSTAVDRILRRSPELEQLVRGNVTSTGLNTGGILRGTFFVTGMTPKQTKQTQRLIAQVIEERPGKSVVSKLIRKMNLGDFVATTKLVTSTDLTSARLETVLRTNLNRASTEGLAETLREPKVQAFVPLVKYSATGDSRTRPTHRAFDGYIGTMEMFDRQGCAPPCGFNCRCALIPVSAARALAMGLVDNEGNVDYAALTRHNGRRQALVNTGQIPDPGFVNG